jgi:hypothetical protein
MKAGPARRRGIRLREPAPLKENYCCVQLVFTEFVLCD